MEVLLYEVKAGVDSYLRGLGRLSPMKSLADVIQFNAAHPAEEMPYFGQDRLLRAEAKGPLTEEPYLQAKRKLSSFARTIDRLVEKYRLDALAALTSDPAQLFDPLLGGKLSSNGSSTPAAVAGYPDVTVPTGQIGGLPVGLSFFGSALSDAHLLALARDYERYARARRPPQFLPTVTAESEN
jgi:amidase